MSGALFTDLYELTMAAGYQAAGQGRLLGSFELFVRELPSSRGYLVAAGLDPVLSYLESWRCCDDEIAYLRSLPALERAGETFFDRYLRDLRFTGEVWAVPEGTPVFAGEPILRVTAPLAEAQLVETAVLSTVLFQTAVASKASRVVEAAAGRPVTEFGGRRAHGVEAAVSAARASVLAGCAATSNVEAGRRYGVPVAGTMAHSWVMAASDETTAFTRWVELFGDRSVLLIDTYDPLAATRKIVRAGLRPSAVRLDSGDLERLSRQVRVLLDEGGLDGTAVLASGDLDEHRVAALVGAGAPIDGFGVGTALSTSGDAPSLSGVYKLVELERSDGLAPLMKLSTGKRTDPGAKQVWRVSEQGSLRRDVVGLAAESGPRGGAPLLDRVMQEGQRTADAPPFHLVRERCRAAVGRLPPAIRRLEGPAEYPVERSAGLRALATRLEEELRAGGGA